MRQYTVTSRSEMTLLTNTLLAQTVRVTRCQRVLSRANSAGSVPVPESEVTVLSAQSRAS